MIIPATPPEAEADAGRRNMLLLTQLRWLAVGGQLATVAFVDGVLGVALPVVQLLMSIGTLAALNIASHVLIASGAAFTNGALTAALLFDVTALAVQLQLSGGVANPFAWLFLLHVMLGAVLLRPRSAWIVAAATLVALALLTIAPRPLLLPASHTGDPMRLYLAGSLVCFVLIAVLILAFVIRIARNLSDRDAALAASRQRVAEDDHIVRMGLLASGAAHELGTPLATLSVLASDWRAMPRLAKDAELAGDLAEMETAIQRCKAIVSGILMSAGEARGVAPEVTSIRRFLDQIIAEWRADRRLGQLDYRDDFGADLTIVADPALRQVIGNVIDNAAEASPDWIGVAVTRAGDTLAIEVSDRGSGFTPDTLAQFGRPYSSTKDRPGGGLGLFLLVNVLRSLGGGATAANRAEGGAVVRITLPLSAIRHAG